MKKLIAVLLACTLLTGCFFSSPNAGNDDTPNLNLVPEVSRGTQPVESCSTQPAGATIEATTPPTTELYGYGMATVTATDLNIRSGPGTNYGTAGQIANGTRIRITEITFTNGVAWGRYESGWLCMDYVTLDDPSDFPVGTPGKWSALTLASPTSIRFGPGANYSTATTLPVSSMVELTGKVGQWYRTDKGWLHEGDVYLYGSTTKDAPLKVTVTATDLNLRTHPNTTSAVLRTLRKDQELEILFQVSINGTRWGCIKDGWVCMDYVEEVKNDPLLGKWYYYELSWLDAAYFSIKEFIFSNGNTITEKEYTYDLSSASLSADVRTMTGTYTLNNNKVSFSSPLYYNYYDFTLSSDTLSNGWLIFVRGSVDDAVAEIAKLMAKAKQNAQTNVPTILGSWQHMEYYKDTMTFPLGCDYTFYENGTYVLGTVAEGVGTYDPETGKVSWRSGTGSCCESGIYTFDGSTLKLECYGAERFSYTEVEDKTIAASVEGDVLTIYGVKAYHGTLEEIVARLMAEAS